jgi:uncharacterized spore protein YtfJ
MIDTTGLASTLERGHRFAEQYSEKLFAATRPGAVFSEPVRSGDYTVITASEISAGGGFGFGGGAGAGTETSAAGSPDVAGQPSPGGSGAGGGGGGGGGSMARPVATIVVGPDGVKVQPIVDVTKLAIAFATAWGAVAFAAMRMRRASRS